MYSATKRTTITSNQKVSHPSISSNPSMQTRQQVSLSAESKNKGQNQKGTVVPEEGVVSGGGGGGGAGAGSDEGIEGIGGGASGEAEQSKSKTKSRSKTGGNGGDDGVSGGEGTGAAGVAGETDRERQRERWGNGKHGGDVRGGQGTGAGGVSGDTSAKNGAGTGGQSAKAASNSKWSDVRIVHPAWEGWGKGPSTSRSKTKAKL